MVNAKALGTGNIPLDLAEIISKMAKPKNKHKQCKHNSSRQCAKGRFALFILYPTRRNDKQMRHVLDINACRLNAGVEQETRSLETLAFLFIFFEQIYPHTQP